MMGHMTVMVVILLLSVTNRFDPVPTNDPVTRRKKFGPKKKDTTNSKIYIGDETTDSNFIEYSKPNVP